MAAKDTRLDTFVGIVVACAVQAIIGFGLYELLGQTGANFTTRALTALAPFLVYPLAFVMRMATVPAEMWREDQAALVAERVDPTAHCLGVFATVDDNFLEGGDKLLGVVRFTNSGDVPLEVGKVLITATINRAKSYDRTGRGQVIRRGESLEFHFDFGSEPLQTIPGSVAFEVVADYGPPERDPGRSIQKSIEATYRREGGVLTASARTISENETSLQV